MSVTYHIYPKLRLITYQVSGKNDVKTILKLYDDITEDPQYDDSYSGVGDWREAITSFNRDEVQAQIFLAYCNDN